MKLPAMTITRFGDKDDPFKRSVVITLEDGREFKTSTDDARKLSFDGHSPLVEQALLAVWYALGKPE
jgi:hypothetical protein